MYVDVVKKQEGLLTMRFSIRTEQATKSLMN